jgi:hypothetical protein
MWHIKHSNEIEKWLLGQGEDSRAVILKHLIILQTYGPTLGRPYVDTIKGSKINKLKELRINSGGHVFRIFFAFDEKRDALLLIAGDKRGDTRFYKRIIPLAEKIYYRIISEK